MCRKKQTNILTVVLVMAMALMAAGIMWQRVEGDAQKDRIQKMELASLRSEQAEVDALDAVVNFAWDHPDRAFIIADKTGKIVAAHGGCALIGWHREALLGRMIYELRPGGGTEAYRAAYLARAEQGRHGEIRSFTKKPMLGEHGQTLMVNGLIVWNEERGMFAAYLAQSDDTENGG
jgi:PAS domain S-box-containing protein